LPWKMIRKLLIFKNAQRNSTTVCPNITTSIHYKHVTCGWCKNTLFLLFGRNNIRIHKTCFRLVIYWKTSVQFYCVNIYFTPTWQKPKFNSKDNFRFLVNDQLDAHFSSMYLLQFSTCFEQLRAHHQENQLYQYNLWYMSFCVSVTVSCAEVVLIQLILLMMSTDLLETCREMK
jgi:hypothetical protein